MVRALGGPGRLLFRHSGRRAFIFGANGRRLGRFGGLWGVFVGLEQFLLLFRFEGNGAASLFGFAFLGRLALPVSLALFPAALAGVFVIRFTPGLVIGRTFPLRSRSLVSRTLMPSTFLVSAGMFRFCSAFAFPRFRRMVSSGISLSGSTAGVIFARFGISVMSRGFAGLFGNLRRFNYFRRLLLRFLLGRISFRTTALSSKIFFPIIFSIGSFISFFIISLLFFSNIRFQSFNLIMLFCILINRCWRSRFIIIL